MTKARIDEVKMAEERQSRLDEKILEFIRRQKVQDILARMSNIDEAMANTSEIGRDSYLKLLAQQMLNFLNTGTGRGDILNEIIRYLKENNLDYTMFSEPLDEVLEAIQKELPIENVNIAEKIKDKSYRFVTEGEPALSLHVSNTISYVYHSLKKTISADVSALGRKKRAENADDHAISTYNILEELKKRETFSSFRETLKVLNDNNVPTARGGKWHMQTLQDLYKRWESLGIKKELTPK